MANEPRELKVMSFDEVIKSVQDAPPQTPEQIKASKSALLNMGFTQEYVDNLYGGDSGAE